MASDKGGSDLGTAIIAGAIGATVGAVVALLLAPKTGAELRAEIGEKAKDVAEKARECAAKAAENCCGGEEDEAEAAEV